jgi:enoyl-CoA hydratase/carnithine racemase
MIAESERIETRKDVPSATLLISRSEQHNALAADMVDAMQQAIEDFQGEKSVRGIIITGAGNTFCAGSDLKELACIAQQPDAFEIWERDAERIQLLIETLLRCPKPIVAALNGDAIGLGAVLALCADVVIGHNHSRIWLPEVRRGLSGSLGAALVTFRVGASVACSAVHTGEPISAERANRLGLIHEIVEPDLVWAKAHELIGKFALGASQAATLSRRFINETLGENLFSQLAIATAQMATARTTDAAREGISAFIEKRTPQFP